MKTFAWVCLFVLCGATICFAMDGQAATSVPPLGKAILTGALSGLLAAVIGYASQKANPDGSHEPFSIPQAASTAVVGAVIGAVAGWQRKDLSSFETWLDTTPFVAMAEMVLKSVFRKVPWLTGISLQGIINTIKGGTKGNPPATPPPSTPS